MTDDWTKSRGTIGSDADQLTDAGCEYKIAVDKGLDAKRRGWWQDGVFLAENAGEALRLLRGGS